MNARLPYWQNKSHQLITLLYNTMLINTPPLIAYSPAYLLLGLQLLQISLLLPKTKSDLTSAPILDNISLYNKPKDFGTDDGDRI